MEEHIWILIFLRKREEFYDAETVKRFLSVLAGHHFRVIADAESHFSLAWYCFHAELDDEATLRQQGIDTTLLFTPGVSPLLLEETNTYVAEQRKTLSFDVYSTSREGLLKRFEFGGSLEPDEGYILLSINWELFDAAFAGEDSEPREAYWIELLQEIYRCWHPLYAYRFSHGSGPLADPKQEDIRALAIHSVYGTNFFGPEFVAKLGREKLLSIPAYRVVELGDGGIFLYCAWPEEIRAATKRLGLLPVSVDKEDEETDETPF